MVLKLIELIDLKHCFEVMKQKKSVFILLIKPVSSVGKIKTSSTIGIFGFNVINLPGPIRLSPCNQKVLCGIVIPIYSLNLTRSTKLDK